jgi:protein-S-isoprenylcysteine O-methyltransferase Ste14
MDLVRWALGWFLVVILPPAVLYWFAIHPFAALWRRIGHGSGLVAGFATLLSSAFVLALGAPRWLRADFGLSWPLVAAGVALQVPALLIQRARKKYLTARVLMGVPELARDAGAGRLFSAGIYARIRHPRYVEVTLSATGYALVSNHPAAYLALAASVAGIFLVVLIEERELRSRFGADWDAYAARTPRFLPRRARSGRA